MQTVTRHEYVSGECALHNHAQPGRITLDYISHRATNHALQAVNQSK
jgi:hypothetical protein